MHSSLFESLPADPGAQARELGVFLLLLASTVYVFLASGHFVGLLFRENANELESIYLLR